MARQRRKEEIPVRTDLELDEYEDLVEQEDFLRFCEYVVKLVGTNITLGSLHRVLHKAEDARRNWLIDALTHLEVEDRLWLDETITCITVVRAGKNPLKKEVNIENTNKFNIPLRTALTTPNNLV